MADFSPIRIQPLVKGLDRAVFSCGVVALDSYFKTRVSQDRKRNLASVFVALAKNERIAGFYTLSSFSIELREVPQSEARKLPRYPIIPATLIGRLAVDRDFQGQGLGGVLLVDALKRVIEINAQIASYAVVTEAKDDGAVAFYQKYGFLRFLDAERRLYLPVATARALFS